MHERRLLGDPSDPPRTREQHVVEEEGSTHMRVYVCVICWCQRLVKQRGSEARGCKAPLCEDLLLSRVFLIP